MASNNIIRVKSNDDNDLFLFGDPEITFFKSVYRRYTNFASEVIKVDFDSDVDLSSFINVQIPKRADLMHSVYLEVKLPECYYPKNIKDNERYKFLNDNIKLIQDFISINNKFYNNFKNLVKDQKLFTIWQNELLNEYQIYNICDDQEFNKNINIIIELINDLYNKSYNIQLRNYNNLMINLNNRQLFDLNYDSDLLKIKEILNIVNWNNKDFYVLINQLLYKLIITRDLKPSYKYAWIDKLGYSIIEYIDLYIGGLKITREYGQVMDIMTEFKQSEINKKAYNSLIGNIEILTNFDENYKPEFTLLIPLQFWFCQKYNMSLPLLALKYNDINLRFKFREYKDLAYIEKPIWHNDNLDNEINKRYGEDLFDNSKLQFNLLVEYIFLDKHEREQLVKTKHNYIIEQVQNHKEILDNTILDLENNDLNIRILDFKHPTKGFIWTFQPNSYYNNFNKFIKCQFCRYDINNLSPIKKCSISLNHNILISQDNKYYEDVEPYEHFKNSGKLGIYSYWFSLLPNETQPTGSCDLSKIKEVLFNLNINKEIFNNQTEEKFYVFNCYAINYNILQIQNGYANILYN